MLFNVFSFFFQTNFMFFSILKQIIIGGDIYNYFSTSFSVYKMNAVLLSIFKNSISSPREQGRQKTSLHEL